MLVSLLAALALAPSVSSLPNVRAADCRNFPTPPASAAVANDNQSRAGTLRDGVLTLKLVARVR